jgi:hypothetical protein
MNCLSSGLHGDTTCCRLLLNRGVASSSIEDCVNSVLGDYNRIFTTVRIIEPAVEFLSDHPYWAEYVHRSDCAAKLPTGKVYPTDAQEPESFTIPTYRSWIYRATAKLTRMVESNSGPQISAEDAALLDHLGKPIYHRVRVLKTK